MDINERLALSYYKEIAAVDEEHGIFLVQHQHTHKIFIKKILSVYNIDVFNHIKNNPVKYTPNIYELVMDDSKLILIEEYISGNTLEEMLESGHKFEENEIRDIIIKLCRIVGNLHGRTPSIIHRDIKPSNIILTPSGDVVLLDLGAAKNLSSGKSEDTTLLGTKGYAAPEQYGFGTSNIRTDIYAIGMLINTLVIGSFSTEICKNSEFTPIIKKCTQMNPADRYKSVDEILKKLEAKQLVRSHKHSSWQSFLPPGYRTFNPVYMIIATVVYAFIIWLCSSFTVSDTSPALISVLQVALALMLIGVIFLSANYLEVHRFFPLTRSNNVFVKVLGVILLDIAYIAAIIIIMVILMSVIDIK